MPENWREVLIVTGGMTPQVVTETVYALAQRERDPTVPAKIICAITTGAAGGFGERLETALSRLKSELGVTADWQRRERSWHTGTTGLYIEAPRRRGGIAVEDIRSDADSVAFGDMVSEIVRRETLDPAARVHLSLAGGRKTMSFHGGAAMSLFGRAHDELSHVLVHPAEFEQCPDFWFPTRHEQIIERRGGGSLNAREARIELALIPFIRVRERLPPGLIERAMDYASYVSQQNAFLAGGPLSLELITGECLVRIGGLAEFTLPNTDFALYQLMAEWRLCNYAGASSRGIGPDHRGWLTARMFEEPQAHQPNPVQRFIAIYEATFTEGVDRAAAILNTVSPNPVNKKQQKDNREAIAIYKSRLMARLQGQLQHADLADRFGAPLTPVRPGGENGNRVVFGVRLDPSEINIIASCPGRLPRTSPSA